ncbi:MAG TPA: hypothetical protein VMG12_24410, partial [Polyangiaceae bacterium]|nr:hypothetical protein [Polyangiaceae bacterium]
MQRCFASGAIIVFASSLLAACGNDASEPSAPEAVTPVAAAGAGGGAPSSMSGNAAGGQATGSDVPAGSECMGPECACGAGLTACNASLLSGAGDAVACVDLQNDATHCGGCGTSCGLGQVCVGGSCAAMCPLGLSPCGGSCVDVASDSLNCGACGRACTAGACSGGACPAGKDCAVTTSVTTPVMADFESYVAGTPADMFGFSFNAPAGSPLAVYAGPYQYGDGTGTQALSMVPGDGSNFAASITNAEASGWGGALGFWMGCIDASTFDGLAFTMRGNVPGGVVTLTTLTEATSPPSATDPAAGGTCLEGCAAPTVSFPIGAQYGRVLLPWSAFNPGTANGAPVPATGRGITGLTFSVALEWGETGGAGVYGPVAAGYELAIDDVGFFHTTEQCTPGQSICDSR